jgi:beta-N-acetylhexosaminidase
VSTSENIGQKLLLAFQGKEITPEMKAALARYRPGGITFFRSYNIENPRQVRELTADLQQYAKKLALPPLLIAVDQEGGQLMAIGEGTAPLPGNMALGATGSGELAFRAGEVLGRELSAMGINMNYAPCCDVNINPLNPVIGTRSFGENPLTVSELSAAIIRGIQSQGVAAVAKHFPGHGDTSSDSHLGLPSLPHALERLQAVEFPPFRAAIQADVKAVMSAHLALPAIDGADAPPATLSKAILRDLLRDQLGFNGVTVSDAMDMHAIRQGKFLAEECARAAKAGIDLLLITADAADHERAWDGISKAYLNDSQSRVGLWDSLTRISTLKRWLADNNREPSLDVVGCAEHLSVAEEIAERSVTLVRDDVHLLPVTLNPEQRISVILPHPADLTPADTSSYITPDLADSLRDYHPNVDEIVLPFAPDEHLIQETLKRINGSGLIVCATLNAFDCPQQAAMVNHVLKCGIPSIILAMRMPYDLIAFPQASTYLCTYSIQSPSMKAAAKVIMGKLRPQGKLPVSIPDLYPVGYKLE